MHLPPNLASTMLSKFCAFCRHDLTSAEPAFMIGPCMRQPHQELSQGCLVTNSTAHANWDVQITHFTEPMYVITQ